MVNRRFKVKIQSVDTRCRFKVFGYYHRRQIDRLNEGRSEFHSEKKVPGSIDGVFD
jgi:hypothetical protein